MSKKIRVLLLEHVSQLGSAGDIIIVTEGFARNSLFPSGKAALATDQVAAKHHAKRAEKQAEERERLATLQGRAEILDHTEIVFKARVKEGNEIFGSISKKQILEQLKQEADLELRPKDITVEAPIKELGTYTMTMVLAPGIECMVKVVVIADGTESKSDKDE